MYMGDVKSKTFIDTNASSGTFVAAAAQPTTTFTLAKTSFGTNTARKITATTTGSSDGGKTITIVGTDENGEPLYAAVKAREILMIGVDNQNKSCYINNTNKQE